MRKKLTFEQNKILLTEKIAELRKQLETEPASRALIEGVVALDNISKTLDALARERGD